MIHALASDRKTALCVYMWRSKGTRAGREPTTVRGAMVRCAECCRILERKGGIRLWLAQVYAAEGEIGTLDPLAGAAEARRYWTERNELGARIPPLMRALYLYPSGEPREKARDERSEQLELFKGEGTKQ